MKIIFNKIAKHFIKNYDIKKMVGGGCKIGENFHLGGSYVDPGFFFLIEIGDNVTLSKATLLAHDGSTQHCCKKSKVGKIKIGNNVFVGYNSIILPNVRIGDNVVIGAGSVVVHDIPSNSIAVGNPCIVISSYDDYRKKTLENMKTHPVYPTYHTYKNEEEIKRMQEELENNFGYDE